MLDAAQIRIITIIGSIKTGFPAKSVDLNTVCSDSTS